MKRTFTPEQIEAALKKPLPGLPAQQRMAPVPRPMAPPFPGHRPRQGGILVLLYPDPDVGELCLVLTRRTENVGAHKGQISFPGGGVEPGDPSTAHTAIREACEEIGVCTDNLRILGNLTPLYVQPSDFCIHPHVAYLPSRPVFVAQPEEVAEILEIPLTFFLNENHVVVEDWTFGDGVMRVPYFNVSGNKVWGATAIVLGEFIAILKDPGFSSP